ncbi:MAG: NUDIX hydrolase [Alphaproteobacteria bacterium]|nr:NUDIX hydrolase [Alphaproteobacteria bacterium]
MGTTATVSRKAAAARGTGVQYGALPYRMADDTLEILLVTSRRTHRWIIPKGWPMPGRTPASCAAREALEEAGIAGDIGEVAIGRFRYAKQLKSGVDLPCWVEVFPLKVTKVHDAWPEKDARERRWCTAQVAAAIVDEPQLRLLILKFEHKLNGRKR